MRQFLLSCPQCGEAVLPSDKFCFRCGSRLPKHTWLALRYRLMRFGLSQLLLVLMGVAALLVAAYVVHRQSQVIAESVQRPRNHQQPAHEHPHRHIPAKPAHTAKNPILHPVVVTTTTTVSPHSDAPSPNPGSKKPTVSPIGAWATEQATYQNVQFSLKVPPGMTAPLATSSTAWTWGARNSPYQVTVSVVPDKSTSADVELGTHTYGTAIQESPSTASQQLFVNWTGHEWVEVAMAVPKKNVAWLAAIAESLRVR